MDGPRLHALRLWASTKVVNQRGVLGNQVGRTWRRVGQVAPFTFFLHWKRQIVVKKLQLLLQAPQKKAKLKNKIDGIFPMKFEIKFFLLMTEYRATVRVLREEKLKKVESS